jgi:hypothetical protein
MADEMNTAAGGLHPGRPVIWPTGKSAPTSSTPQATAGTQTSQQAAQAAKSAPTPQEIAQAQAAVKALQAASVARQFSAQDLKQLLINQGIPDSESNEKLATTMLRYGLEVSRSNLSKLSSMMGSDTSQSMQEAAIILLMKGSDSPAAAKTLSQFLAENPQLAAQLMSLKGNIEDMQSAMMLGKDLMDPKLISQLTALLSQFSESIDQLPGKYKFSGKGSVGRSELSSDLRALKSLLEGLPGKENLPDSAEGQVLESNLSATKNRLDQMINGLASQAMLSKQSQKSDMNYTYYQIPNTMMKPPTTVDLIVKRSDAEGGKKIDVKDTQIIMSFETLNLGRVAVKMSVKDKNVEFLFNTQNENVKAMVNRNTSELATALTAKDYNATKMQVNVNPSMCAIKPFLIPFLGIEDLMKIDISI